MKKALLISCFDWYKTRLEPIRELLINQDYDVTVIESDFDHIKKIPITKKYCECTYIHVPSYKNNISFSRIQSHLSFSRSVRKVLEQLKPDLVYLEIPPNNTANYCRKYKKQHPDTKLILDIIDLWPESMPLGKLKKTPPAIVWRQWRDNCIKAADHVFTECDLYREKLKNVLDSSKTSTLYLFKEQSDEERILVQETIRDKKSDRHTVKFAYLGSMNNIIDIKGICGVIERFINAGYNCELHAIGDGECRERFEFIVQATGCLTQFYGLMFEEVDKIKILASCDYAFNMMKGELSVGLTIKSIDYLSYGLPLINNIKGDTWKMVEDERIGVNIDDLNLLARSFDQKDIVKIFETRFSKKSFIDKVNGVLL